MRIPDERGDPNGLDNDLALGDDNGEPDVLGGEHNEHGSQGVGHRYASAHNDAAAYRSYSKSVRIQSKCG